MPESSANVVIIGGSYSGVELATNLVARLRGRCASVTLVERGNEILSQSPVHNQARARDALTAAGVDVRCSTAVLSVDVNGVTITSKDQANDAAPASIPADLVLWTAGSITNSLLRDPASFVGTDRDAQGRLRVDDSLQVQGDLDNLQGTIFALGDNAALAAAVPSNAQVAFQQVMIHPKCLQ